MLNSYINIALNWAGNCFICENPLPVGETVNFEHGLQTLKNASNEKDDGHIEFLNSLN